MKKLFSLAMVMIMALALCVPAFAASGTSTANKGTITINNAQSGQTYTAYQIFELESFSDTNPDDKTDGAYSYKVVDANWKEFITTGAGKDYIEYEVKGTNTYVKWKGATDDATVAAFAKAALAYAKETDGITGTSITAAGTTVTFTNMSLGYYLIDSSLGALCSLNTTDLEAEIQEKNEKATIDKLVQEGNTWGEENDAKIGDTVNYKVTITAKAGAENYVLHDTMTSGLTFNNSVTVTLNGSTVAATNYTLTTTGLTDDCTFEVSFTKAFCETLVDGDSIVVTYSATLNANAVIEGDGNTNTAILKYGDNTETLPSTTTTKTWDFDVYKYFLNGTTKTDLANAKFVLTAAATRTDNDAITFATESDNVYEYSATGTVTEFTSPADGKFTLQGLDSGVYYLHETAAPDGYNLLGAPIKVEIKNDGTVLVDDVTLADNSDVVEVLNQSGIELPSTGGMGTTIFYTVGGILMAGAAILLITKKKMANEQ